MSRKERRQRIRNHKNFSQEARENAYQSLLLLGYPEWQARAAINRVIQASANNPAGPNWGLFLRMAATAGLVNDT